MTIQWVIIGLLILNLISLGSAINYLERVITARTKFVFDRVYQAQESLAEIRIDLEDLRAR